MLLLTYKCVKTSFFRPVTYRNAATIWRLPVRRRCSTQKGGEQQLAGKESTSSSSSSEWRAIVTRFLPIGLCLVAVMQWRAYRKHQGGGERVASQLEISCYKLLPLNAFSRCWGAFAGISQPIFLRPYVYGLYSRAFGVNVAEAADEDFCAYQSLTDFFIRTLKDGVRPIDGHADLVSPCDGRVLHVTSVHAGKVEQVKGITYPVEAFIGANVWNPPPKTHQPIDYENSLIINKDKGHRLYQCVIYLAPGDYHRFHSPTEWRPFYRRHFPGRLLSVNPSIARWIPGLFCTNERAVYVGEWKHGFFSYTPVGATNVGSMRVYFDRGLVTNSTKIHDVEGKCLGDRVRLGKGEMIGEFRMGSTIVLLFEAPSSFRFNVTPGQQVQVGQALGSYTDRNNNLQDSKHTQTALNVTTGLVR